jgi:NADH-quinone oxidoreductase subunit F
MKQVKTIDDLDKIRKEFESDILLRGIGTNTDKKYVMVCGGTGCISSGCKDIISSFEKEIHKRKVGDKAVIIKTGCSGICELGPLAIVYPEGVLYVRLKPEYIPEIVDTHFVQGKVIEKYVFKDPNTNTPVKTIDKIPFFQKQKKFARRNIGIIDPEIIGEYIGTGGYQSLANALLSHSPEDIIKVIKDSGLRGRGGGGFPTGIKWEATAKAVSENGNKYVVCNADEGDPGAFMDRSQLEDDPHSVVEGMAIAGFAVGASFGYIYCRAEYPLAIERLETAISQAREYGLLGKNILGTKFSFDIEIRMGAGAFVCGEETALIASIEGHRGEPKPKPPFPAQKGVWDCPTVLNNVETFANVPPILKYGAEYFSQMGTKGSKGTKIFALAGAIKNVGLIEVPMGISLGEIIYDIGGGIINDKEFKSAQIGGPSGGCIPRKNLNVLIDYESLKAAGAMMGSGGLIIMSEDTCMVDIARYFMEFVQDESCGKCPPCRIGTKRMLEILDRITQGKGKEGDIEELISLGEDIKITAICGLGQTAPNPILSTITNFRDEYEEHIKNKRCPAGVCAELVYAPCQNACPAGVNVPSFVALTSAGRYDEALKSHLDRNPFPVACGMTCTHPCEYKCRRATLDDPIAIREIKRFMTGKGSKGGVYPMPGIMKRPNGETKKIAIIGGGPAGLTSAYFLRRLGHKVMVYEGQEKMGGMLRYGIPEYRYPKRILDNEIKNIIGMGIDYKCSTIVGKDISFNEIKNKHDAVIIAIGGWKGKGLNMPNDDVEGVIPGTDFLWKVTYKDIRRLDGKKVVIIGGGNTAIDVARTSLRLGASKVVLAYRRTIDQMPADPEEIDELIEEGIYPEELKDIEEILVKDNKVSGIRCRKQSLGEFDASGRKKPIALEGNENIVVYECDYLIPAISQAIDMSFAKDIKLNKDGTAWVKPDNFQTSIEKVFAAGDVVTLSNLAIAIGQGEKCAVAVEQYLNPGSIKEFSWRMPKSPDVFYDTDTDPVETKRISSEFTPVKDRIKSFEVVNRGVQWEKNILKESKRCLRCDYKIAEGGEI